MFRYFWDRIKIFFVAQSRLSRVTIMLVVLVVVIGVFAFVLPALAVDDDIGQKIGRFFATLLLYIAVFLGHILVLIISLLLDIVSYNDFVDATAVNYGWTVVRDICNLFFILILLVIGFGSVLKLESYKYNQLLGKLIMMIVLVNFSKMIAGFFIDISQVVLMTFTNAFAATAAENFTSALGLKEMLGFTSAGGDNAAGITNSLSGSEMFGLAILPVIMLVVAIFTMLAMVMVFLIRIIMLWVLLVLSPLAYFFSVLPSTQQYGKKWWDNFTKWVVTGPVLAFFIWFGLTMIAGGAIEPSNLGGENEIQSGQGAGGSAVVAGIGAASSSESVLQFIMAIGIFVIALTTAQSLGGMAGGFAGKMLGKLQGMGTGALKMAGAPLRGAGELAKAGGRKIRRGYRDSKLGKYTNVGAMMAGAKQRGEQLESESKDISKAKGRDLWDKRPQWMGGGGEPVTNEMMVKAKYQREAASTLSTLQKEQKGAQMDDLCMKEDSSLNNTNQRQGMTIAQATPAHTDDNMAMKKAMYERKWEDQYGQKHKGFGFYDINDEELDDAAVDAGIKRENYDDGDDGAEKFWHAKEKLRYQLRYDAPKEERTAFRDADAFADFVAASVSPKQKASNKHIDEAAARVLYDVEPLGIKNLHGYMAGVGTYQEKLGRIGFNQDRRERRKIQNSEVNKWGNRQQLMAPYHNMAVQHLTPEGKQMLISGNNKESFEYDYLAKVGASYEENEGEAFKHAISRIEELMGDFDSSDKRHEVHNDLKNFKSLGHFYQKDAKMLNVHQRRTGQQGLKMNMRDEKGEFTGEEKQYDSFDDFREKYILKEVMPELEKKHNDTKNDKNATERQKGVARRNYEEMLEYWGEESKDYKTPAELKKEKLPDDPAEKKPSKTKPVTGTTGTEGEQDTETRQSPESLRDEASAKREKAGKIRSDMYTNKDLSKEKAAEQEEKANTLVNEAKGIDKKADGIEDEKVAAKQKEVDRRKEEAKGVREEADTKRNEASKIRQEILAKPDMSQEKQDSINEKAKTLVNEAENIDKKAKGIEDGVVVLEKEVRVEQVGNERNRMGAQMRDSNVTMNEASLQKFANLIKQSLDEMDLTADPMSTVDFEKKMGEIGKQFEESLSDAPQEQKDDFTEKYKQTSEKLEIGTISEKQLQRNIIAALNNLSRVLGQNK